MNTNRKKQTRRKIHVRTKLQGSTLPRLTIHRSNKHIYAQIIDDQKHRTVASVSDAALDAKGTKTERAKKVGSEIADRAKKAKVTTVVFDRGAYKYHGRVKELAEGAREAGLKF